MTPTNSPSLTIVVLTFNEEGNLPACLESVKGLATPIFIVDSGSTDKTEAIASSFGAQILRNPFQTHTSQWTWALSQIPPTDWALCLDADQRLTPELVAEILATLPKTGIGGDLDKVDGFYFNRRHIFRGKWVRWGGLYPKYLLKLFRPGKVSMDSRDLVDHHFQILTGTARFRHDLIEENVKEHDISFWMQKHIKYADLLAREEVRRKADPAALPNLATALRNPDARILWAKSIWTRMPRYVRPLLYYFYRYFLRLGFLDGKQGFVFHFMQALWFRILIDIKYEEYEGGKR